MKDRTCTNCIHKDVCFMYRLNYISAREGYCANYDIVIPPEVAEKFAETVVQTINSIDWDKTVELYTERPKGKWVLNDMAFDIPGYKCTACGEVLDGMSVLNFKFCPECGAEMEVGTHDPN